jgi:hypothetical protein
MSKPALRLADSGQVEEASPGQQPTPIGPRLWDWPRIVRETGIARRTLEKEIKRGLFPAPVLYVGSRPRWSPRQVVSYCEGQYTAKAPGDRKTSKRKDG